jgi:PST family polysaccharide transporter
MTTQAERNARALSTEHLKDDLGGRAARGGMIAISAQPIRMVLQFVTSAILARLLAPADFGLVAMAAAVTGFVAIFSELGLGAATMQREEIDQDTVSGLFFMNLAVGLALVPVALLLAPVAAAFFKDERVFHLIIALSLTLPMAAAGAQHTGLLMRSMRWMTTQWTAIAGQAVGAVAAVLVAWKTDLGYWALVVNAWGAAGATLLFIWLACPWRPTLVKDWSGARDALGFGLNLTGFTVVNFFHRQLDNIIIGWRSGAAELGYYARAYTLMMMPINMFNGPFNSAVTPALSRLQNEPERWRRAFLDSLGLACFLGGGLAAGLIAAADPIVAILYGPGWDRSATVFQYLAISIFAGTPLSATGWIYMSLGRTNRMLQWSLMFTPCVAGAFLLSMNHGATGIALAYAVVMNLALVPGYAFATHRTPVGLWDVMKVILPMSGAGAIAAVAGVMLPIQDMNVVARLILSGSVAGLVYLVLAGGFLAKAQAYSAVRERLMRLAGSLLDRVRTLRPS